jgi:hypothetical protein
MSFTSDLRAFSETAINNAEQVYRGSAFRIIRQIIRRTPVDTGRLRGNWQSDLNSPATGTTNRLGASASIAEALSVCNSADLSDSIYFTNNLPYAVAIENGSSTTQAPRGMVKVTVLEFVRTVNQQAGRL